MMPTVQEIRFPLALSADTSEKAMERCREVSPPSPCGRARPPVNSTGGAPLEFFRCRDTFKCGWVGTDVLTRGVRAEPGEFDPLEIVYDLMCPRCKSSVVFVPLCCDCNAAASDLGSERCGACDVRAEQEEQETRMMNVGYGMELGSGLIAAHPKTGDLQSFLTRFESDARRQDLSATLIEIMTGGFGR